MKRLPLDLLTSRSTGVPRSAFGVPRLVDTFGRVHNNLRISVTDRCNLRCTYCMPEDVTFRPKDELLTFEEIAHFVGIATGLGVNKIRLTGGEPLVRRDLHKLVRLLANVPGVTDLGLTTNGLLLADQAGPLFDAGLRRLNVSLDTLDAGRFHELTRRTGLDRVLGGLAAAKGVGFDPIKVNAVCIRGFTDRDAIPLAQYCRENGFELRFIEYMPIGAEAWGGKTIPGGRAVDLLESEFDRCGRARRRPARPRGRLRFRGRRGSNRDHRLRHATVLSELQPPPADRRRQASQLLVQSRGGRRATLPARSPRRCRGRPDDSAGRLGQVGRARDQFGPVREAPADDAHHWWLIRHELLGKHWRKFTPACTINSILPPALRGPS